MDDEQHHADEEEHPGDLRSGRCDGVDPEGSCNQADDEKYEGVVKHRSLLCEVRTSASTRATAAPAVADRATTITVQTVGQVAGILYGRPLSVFEELDSPLVLLG